MMLYDTLSAVVLQMLSLARSWESDDFKEV